MYKTLLANLVTFLKHGFGIRMYISSDTDELYVLALVNI